MKTLEVALPDHLAQQMKELAEQGCFLDEIELAKQALIDFLGKHRFELQEQFQRDDLQWTLGQKKHDLRCIDCDV